MIPLTAAVRERQGGMMRSAARWCWNFLRVIGLVSLPADKMSDRTKCVLISFFLSYVSDFMVSHMNVFSLFSRGCVACDPYGPYVIFYKGSRTLRLMEEALEERVE